MVPPTQDGSHTLLQICWMFLCQKDRMYFHQLTEMIVFFNEKMTPLLVNCIRSDVRTDAHVGSDVDCFDHCPIFKEVLILFLFTVFFLIFPVKQLFP